jgi:hypothetical protein
MARHNAYCRADDAAGNPAKHPEFTCFRGHLSKLRFLLYAIVGHSFLEYRPEVIFFINQKCLVGYNIYRVLPFVIENDPHRH